MLDSMRNMPELRGVDPNNMSAIVGGRDEIVQPPGRLIGRANLTNGSYEDGRLRDVISGHYGVDSYVAHNYVTSIYGRGGYSSANYGSGGYISNYVSSENALSGRIGGLSVQPGFRVADSVFESFFGPRMNQPSPLGSLAGNVSGGNGGNGGFGLGDFTFNAGENAGRLGSGAFDLGEGSGWNPNRGPDGDPGGGPGGSADAMYGAYRNQIVSRDDSSYYKALAFLAVHDRDDDTIQGGYGEDVLCGGEGDDNLGMPTPVNQAQANQILASKGQDPNYHLQQTIKASIDEQKPRVIGDGGGTTERTQQYVRNLMDREFDPIAPYYPEDIAADPGFEPKKFSEIKENLERDVFNPESLPGGHSGPVGSLGNSLVAGSAIAGEYLEYGLSNIGYAAAHIPGAGSLAKNVVPGKNVGKSSVMSEVEQSALLQQASEITLGKKFTADIATIKQLPKPKQSSIGKVIDTTQGADGKFVVSNKNLRAVLEQAETQTILKKPSEMKISKPADVVVLGYESQIDSLISKNSIEINKKTIQQPYEPRSIKNILEQNHPESTVTSSTIPDINKPNVKLAGKEHPVTGVVFDNRGFPIFDKHAIFDTKISEVDIRKFDSKAHMRAATRDLREKIQSGKFDGSVFTEKQLNDIRIGNERIKGYTWHHHQDTGRMQLIPRSLHRSTGHVGGYDIWGKK